MISWSHISLRRGPKVCESKTKSYGTSWEALPPSDAAGLPHHDRRHLGVQRRPGETDTGKGDNPLVQFQPKNLDPLNLSWPGGASKLDAPWNGFICSTPRSVLGVENLSIQNTKVPFYTTIWDLVQLIQLKYLLVENPCLIVIFQLVNNRCKGGVGEVNNASRCLCLDFKPHQ